MMIKAIFFDIDGTLVSFKTHKIPESTTQALHTLKAKGIKLFIATGRPPYDLKFLIDEFGDLFTGYITFNGQYCYDSTGKILHEEDLNREDLIQFTNYIKDKRYRLWLYGNGLFFILISIMTAWQIKRKIGRYCT